MTLVVRPASRADSGAILRIYKPYITDTAITFETAVPTDAEFADRIDETCKQYPYLVCEVDGTLVGYANASRHRERAAYCYDVDVSVYVQSGYHSVGVASALYTALFDALTSRGYYNAYAAYTVPNEKSRRLHEKFGFCSIGTFHHTGFKLGAWHDVTWMEKALRPLEAPNSDEIIICKERRQENG